MPRGRRTATPRPALAVRVQLAGDPLLYQQPWDDVEAQNRRLAAEQQAEALLRECLQDAEWDHLTQAGYVEVDSPSTPGRSYRVPYTGGRPVLYEDHRPVAQLCLVPTEWLPRADMILLHLMMLRANEEHYLATANRFPV